MGVMGHISMCARPSAFSPLLCLPLLFLLPSSSFLLFSLSFLLSPHSTLFHLSFSCFTLSLSLLPIGLDPFTPLFLFSGSDHRIRYSAQLTTDESPVDRETFLSTQLKEILQRICPSPLRRPMVLHPLLIRHINELEI